MNKYLVILIISIFVSGCYSLKVEKLSEAKKIKDAPIIYVLPQTAFKIEVELEKTNYIPGPYKKYAAEFLGAKTIIEKEKAEWKIVSININDFPIPDTSCYFLIKANAGNILNRLYFSNEGFLISVNNPDAIKTENPHSYSLINNLETSNKSIFEELPVGKIEKFQYDTTYRIITTDTSTRRIPSYKKYSSLKSEAELAKDAADFIIRIRKRRSKLFMGINGSLPTGKALEIMIEELNRTEKEYLSLFQGMEIKEKQTYVYDFIPSPNRINETTVLFRFSEEKGIIDKTASTGTPVLIQLTNLQNTAPIDSLYASNPKINKKNGLIYRIPARTKINVSLNKQVIAEKVSLVAQYGKLHSISKKVLKKTKSIEFYPELGNIKSLK
ncbi:MAG: DUF4831 family protein [Bacteroidales bacterium]|nr:DUF4831 family protein [Bacteroidales bacterium]